MTLETIPHPKTTTVGRLFFFDLVRNDAMLSVIFYHSVAAYSMMAPWWSVHDGASILADFFRQVLDVYMMPVFFFISGYFTLSSLQKKGFGSFITEKLKRIGRPWLLVMVTIIPVIIYAAQLKNLRGEVHGFWNYYLFQYLGGFGTVKLGMQPSGQSTQMHFWYISLLIAFYIVFGVLYQIKKRVTIISPATVTIEEPTPMFATTTSILRTFLLFSILNIAFSFWTMLIFPDMSWLTIDLLLQFQPTKIMGYLLIFGLGIYAYYRQWFNNTTFFSRPGLWAAVSLLLTTGYLFCGQDVFTNVNDSQTLSPLLLLAFATIRSFLCPAILIMLLSLAYKYINRPIAFNQNLAANSFNIYLVHFFMVIVLQNLLMLWRGGPIISKIGIVFLITLPASYVLSRLINRFPRGFAFILIGLSALAGIAMR